MPDYEFFCRACRKVFSKNVTPAEYAEGRVICPHCGSEEVERQVSAFAPVSARNRA